MTQLGLSNLDKAAVLLRSLSSDGSSRVLELLGNEQAGRLRSALNTISRRSDLDNLTRQVVQEFVARQRHAPPGTSSSTTTAAPAAGWVASQYAHNADAAGSTTTATPQLQDRRNVAATTSAEAVTRLRKSNPSILARVLQNEPPRMLALVLQNLPGDQAAAVLKLLPSELRGAAITLMAAGSRAPLAITERVLLAISRQCDLTPETAATDDDEAPFRRLAGILQSVDRDERMRLLELLGTQNQDVAAKIDDCLYDYTDLLRVEDRSLQKIMAQMEQKVLAVALKTAPDTLRDKVMKNISERVRAALVEEMEFLGSVPSAKAEEARKQIAGIIRTQDKEGTLVWIE
ncbi:MAG: hypothetical protein HZA46_01270 [Planctomycetales bacterium]|nr:hypothetical protein [Planctomycetales bacterium]